jgi:N-methylhydantoinase B
MPIFQDGRLISWAAMFGHMTDIGGKVPGSLPTDAKQIYEEGIDRPAHRRSIKRGELQEDILELILHNCRMPHWNRSDFNAIIAACRTARTRVRENMADALRRRHRFISAMRNCSTATSARWALIKNRFRTKKQYFEDYICDDGMGMGPYKIACAMWREGNKVIFDFEGTDPQSIGSINFLLNEEMFKMFCGVFMIMVFDPQILFNDGFYDLMEVRIPEGTLLKPKNPRRCRAAPTRWVASST